MATFPKLFSALNPWSKKVIFHESAPDKAPAATETPVVEDFNRNEVFRKINTTTALEVSALTKKMADQGMKVEEVEKLFKPIVAALEKGEKLDEAGKTKVLKEWADVKSAAESKNGDLASREAEELVETAEVLYRQVEEKLELRANHLEYKSGYIFMEKDENDRVSQSELSSEFKVGDSYTIDFGKKEDPEKAALREKQIRLDQMIPSDVTKVEVVSKKYSETVTLVRSEDGKYRKEGQSTKDRHYYVFDGDKVKVVERKSATAAAPTPTSTSTPSATAEQKPTEATTATSPTAETKPETPVYKEATKEEREAKVKRTEIDQEYNNYVEALRLTSQDSIALPEDFKGKTGAQIDDMLALSHMGEQLLSSLSKLSAIEGKGHSPIGLFENIRTRNLFSKNRVGVNEVSLTVLGKDIETVSSEHATLNKKFNKTPDEEKRLQQLNDFYKALGELKNALENLDFVGTAVEKKDVPQSDADKALAYFFDKNNNGPVEKVTAGEWIRGQRAHEVRSNYYEGGVQAEKAVDARGMNVTEAAAWTKIMVKCSDAEGKLDQTALLKELNRLMQLGLKEAELTKSDYKGTSLPPLEMEGQNSMAYKLEHGSINLPIYKALIQMGYSAEVRAEQDKQELADKKPAIDGMDLSEFTPEQAAEIRKALHQEQVLYLGAMLNRKGELKELGVGVSKRIGGTDEKPVNLTLGIANNVLTQRVTVGAGVNAKVVKNDQFELTLGTGATLNDQGFNLGASVDVNGTPIDKAKIYRLDFTAYAGINTKALAFGIGAALGVTRDLQAVYEKKVLEERSEMASSEAEFLAKHPEFDKATLDKNLDQIAAARGIDKMKHIQFLSAGVGCTFVPPNLFIPYPYLNIAIKGTPYVVYKAASKVTSDERAAKAIEADRKQSGTESIIMYDSGPMMESKDGQLKVAKADIQLDRNEVVEKQVSALNDALKEKDLKVELTSDGRMKLSVLKNFGTTKIMPDPTSNIEVYSENGSTYINLKGGENLSILRLDNFSDHLNSGAYQNTTVYIGEPGMDIAKVEKSNDKVIVIKDGVATQINTQGAYKDLVGTNEKGEADVRLGTKETKIAENAGDLVTDKAILEKEGRLASLLPADFAERREQVALLRAKVSTSSNLEVTAERRAAVEHAVNVLMSDPSTRKDYKQLSVGMKRDDLIAMIEAYNAKESVPASHIDVNDEPQLTYFLQKMMEESLSTMDKGNAAKLEGRFKWNVGPMTKMLMKEGIDEATAKQLSESFMKDIDMDKKTAIVKGSKVSIAVGTEGINGTRSSQWNGEGMLIGARDVYSLDGSIKEKLQASVLRDALYQPFRSQMGKQLLPAADLLFTAEELKDLNRERIESPAYEKFKAILEKLYKGEPYTDGAVSIKPTIEWKVGLYDKCCNFTEVYRTDLQIDYTAPQIETGKAETQTLLKSHPEVKFFGVGGAVSLNARSGTPEEPEPEVDNGSKAPDAGLKPGQITPSEIRPTIIPNVADIGEGGTPTN